MGAVRLFVFRARTAPVFSFMGEFMKHRTKALVRAAMIAALYVALTHLQNFLLPGSTSWAIQFRASEALCVLAFFAPSAIWGLTVGCLLYNLSNAAALPLDFLLGTAATFLAAGGMYLTRGWTVKGCPLLGLLLPALFNGLLVGWELSLYMGGGFWLNGLYVALGEAAVLLSLGSLLLYTLKKRSIRKQLQ